MIEQKLLEIVVKSHTKCDSINNQTASSIEQIKMEPMDEQNQMEFFHMNTETCESQWQDEPFSHENEDMSSTFNSFKKK